ncbi:MAG: hypothetical protein R3B72_46135 [Polyangiaceae bacterium]
MGGPTDTLSVRDFAALDPPRRIFAVMLLVALVLHLPALPTRLSQWFAFLIPTPSEPDEPQQGVVLPIDVDLLSEPEPAATAEPAPAPKPEDLEKALKQEPPSNDVDENAFFDDGPGTEKRGAHEEPEHETDDEPKAPQEPPAAPPPAPHAPDAPKVLPEGKLDDVFDAAGGPGAVRAQSPNVNVYLAADVLRRRKLATTFSQLLTSVPQWNELIGGTGLDPLRDFDRILISGPQFRNPSWIVVAIKFNVTAKRIKAALEKVVARSGEGGKWLDPLTAQFGPKGERYAVLVPSKRTLWILPKKQKEDIERVREAGAFARTPPAGIVVDLKNPANAFKRAPVAFPKTISHMRVHFTPKGDAYEVRAEGWDESSLSAKQNAAFFAQAIDAIDVAKHVGDSELIPDFMKKRLSEKLRFVNDASFTTQGSRIIATAEVTDKQLEKIMSLVRLDLDRQAEAIEKRRKAREEAKAKLDEADKTIEEAKIRRLGPAVRPSASPSAAPAPSGAAPPVAAEDDASPAPAGSGTP